MKVAPAQANPFANLFEPFLKCAKKPINLEIQKRIFEFDERVAEIIKMGFGNTVASGMCRVLVRSVPFIATFRLCPVWGDIVVNGAAALILGVNPTNISNLSRTDILNSIAIGLFVNAAIDVTHNSLGNFAWHLSLMSVNFLLSSRLVPGGHRKD